MICSDRARALRLVRRGRLPSRRRRAFQLAAGLGLTYTYTLVVYGAAGYVTDYLPFQTNLNLQVLRPV